MTRLLTYWIAPCRQKSRMVPGSSLLETVVSLTILLTILTLSFTQMDRISHSLNPRVLYKAHLISTGIMQDEELLVEQAGGVEVDGFRVEKSLEFMDNGLCRVEIFVFDGNDRPVHRRILYKATGIEL